MDVTCPSEQTPGDLFAPFGSLQKGLAARRRRNLSAIRTYGPMRTSAPTKTLVRDPSLHGEPQARRNNPFPVKQGTDSHGPPGLRNDGPGNIVHLRTAKGRPTGNNGFTRDTPPHLPLWGHFPPKGRSKGGRTWDTNGRASFFQKTRPKFYENLNLSFRRLSNFSGRLTSLPERRGLSWRNVPFTYCSPGRGPGSPG